ncbi:MAG: hypothetical protein QM726_21225 [Chitinophagaceae bacterium]
MKKLLTLGAALGLAFGSIAWSNSSVGNYSMHNDNESTLASDTTPKKDTSWKHKKGKDHKKDSTAINR